MIQLRTYEMAVELYHQCKKIRLPSFLQDQMLRAASSVVLNLAEGYGKRTHKDRTRFFVIALGSIRELQAICDLEPHAMAPMVNRLDILAAGVYKLSR